MIPRQARRFSRGCDGWLDRAFGKPRQTVDVEQQGRTLEEILLAIAATHDEEQAQERAGGERPG